MPLTITFPLSTNSDAPIYNLFIIDTTGCRTHENFSSDPTFSPDPNVNRSLVLGQEESNPSPDPDHDPEHDPELNLSLTLIGTWSQVDEMTGIRADKVAPDSELCQR